MNDQDEKRRIEPGFYGSDDRFAKKLDGIERHLASIVRSSNDAIVSVDLDSTIRTWNKGAELIFGYSEAEAVGRPISMLFAPDLWDEQLAILDRLRGGECFSDYRTVGLGKGQKRIDVSLTLSPLTDSTERLVGVSGIARDITEQKGLEEALRRRVEFDAFLFQLSNTFIGLPEEQLDASLEQGLADVGRFLQIDRVTLLELSRDRAEMTVTYSWSRSRVANPPAVLTERMQPWWLRQVLRGDVSLASDVNDLPDEAVAEKEYLRQRGIVSAASIPLRVSGEIAGAITFISTDRRVEWTSEFVNQLRAIGDVLWNALKRRQAMRALLAARETAREELAKTLHDGLQQLLTIAALNLDRHIMSEAERGVPAEGLMQAKNSLDEAITAARSLSVELFPPVLQTAGLPTALRWLADWALSKYGLKVTLSADPRASSDRKDIRTLLFESVRELLFNVVKHAEVDRVAVDLALDPNDTLCITVTDQGRGFDAPELDKRAKVGRAGRGLFSIRERLTMLGGRFDIESAPGRGTRFRLAAPRDPVQGSIRVESSGSHETLAPATPSAAPEPSSEALRILIADDQPVLRKAVRQLLQARPEFQVVGEATNGREAIAQAHVLQPDAVLMDVSMPEMDGIEATRRIHAELPFVHILGFSVYSRTADPHPIELAGAEAFFTKGADMQRLINHLLATERRS